MATVELAEVSKSIRSAMGESAGQFKQAAAASVGNLSKVVKDIASNFAAQRRDITELHNSIQESEYIAQSNSDKLDRVFQESLGIQTSMLSEMRIVSKNISILNRSIDSMNTNLSNNLVGNGGGNILSSLTTGFGDVSGAIAGLVIGGAAAYGLTQMTGGGGGGPTGPGLGESGSSSEAMSFFESKGWSKEQAAGIVGNLQTESGKTLKTNAVGDNGQAYGIAQWHPDRQAKFQQVMGIPIRQSNFKQQLEFVQWELMNSEKRAGEMLKAAGTAIEAARAVDYGYERSTHQHLGQRMANAVALAKGSSSEATPSSTTPSTTTSQGASPDATRVNAPSEAIPSATSPRVESMAKEGGHGPISGAGHEHAEKVEGSAPLPSGDVVALGHALEKMGMRISEHPSFGGVKPVHKGKAHYEGRAIDINFGTGKTEASDPVLGAKFDSLANQLTKLGYKVYWRESGPYAAAGHNNHLHAEIPKGGAPSVPDTYQIAGSPEQRAMQGATPLSGAAAAPPAASAGAPSAAPTAEPVSQAPMTQATMASAIGANVPGQLMGMLGGMLPGGMGGILGGLMPLVTSALQGLESTPNPLAELTPVTTVANQNAQLVKESAVQTQATQETAQLQTVETARNVPSNTSGNVKLASGDQSGYAYNMPGDVGWPDWAALIGGNHWEEMKSYKKNMWG